MVSKYGIKTISGIQNPAWIAYNLIDYDDSITAEVDYPEFETWASYCDDQITYLVEEEE